MNNYNVRIKMEFYLKEGVSKDSLKDRLFEALDFRDMPYVEGGVSRETWSLIEGLNKIELYSSLEGVDDSSVMMSTFIYIKRFVKELIDYDKSKIVIQIGGDSIKNLSVDVYRSLTNQIYNHEELIYKSLKIEEPEISRFNLNYLNELNSDSLDMDKFKTIIKSYPSDIHETCAVNFLNYEEGVINFNCFKFTFNAQILKIYTQFCIAVIEKAMAMKRSKIKRVNTTNCKFSMRVWLIKLKLKGAIFKSLRYLFLRNLTGNPSFRFKLEN